MSNEYWYSDSDKGNVKYLDKNLSQCCSANQKSHIDSNYLKIVISHEFSFFLR